MRIMILRKLFFSPNAFSGRVHVPPQLHLPKIEPQFTWMQTGLPHIFIWFTHSSHNWWLSSIPGWPVRLHKIHPHWHNNNMYYYRWFSHYCPISCSNKQIYKLYETEIRYQRSWPTKIISPLDSKLWQQWWHIHYSAKLDKQSSN